MSRLRDLLAQRTKQLPSASVERPVVAVVMATHEEILRCISEAISLGVAQFLLVGDRARSVSAARAIGAALDGVDFLDVRDPEEACRTAARCAASGEAAVLMKGMVQTAEFVHAVLDSELALVAPGRLLSHLALIDAPRYHKLLALSDAAINIAPSLEQKIEIVMNGVDVLRRIGVDSPKTALIAPVETVNPRIRSTVDAAMLRERFAAGTAQEAPGPFEVDGPFGFDVAVSESAARMKGIAGNVAGRADFVVVPDLDSGNVLYKSLTVLGGAEVAGIVAGARVPIVLTSRADSEAAKLASLLFAIATAAPQ